MENDLPRTDPIQQKTSSEKDYPPSPEETEEIIQAMNSSNEEIYALRTDGSLYYANDQTKISYNLNKPISTYFIWDFHLEITQKNWPEKLKFFRENSTGCRYISRHKYPDGSSRPVEIVSRIINYQGEEKIWVFCRDISSTIRHENKIKELNSLFNSVLDNIPVYLFVKDTKDLRYLYWNKAFEIHSHIPTDCVIGKTDFEIFPNEKDAEHFRNDDLRLLSTGKDIEFIETYQNKSGELRTVKTLKTLIRDDKGEPTFLVGISWDITDMKNSEQELIKARLKAEQSDRLKSTFLSNMSHEIRTPLNAIIGFSRLICDLPDQEEKRNYMEIVENNSELLIQLINDILDLSKIEAGTLEFYDKPTDISELCQKILQMYQHRTAKNVTLLLDLPAELIIQIDGNRLAQVLSNLITNAIKFTSKGYIRFGYHLLGEKIEFYVIDTGCGIPREKLNDIFSRFTKLNSFSQGTGLGLAICKMIVQKMKGEISVESELNKGTTFRFTIPYRSTPLKSTEEPVNRINVKEEMDTQYTILIAEDVESNFLLLKVLIGKKYKLLHAWNGIEAIKLFNEEKPDLILMDIKMPEMDGLEATRIIREKSKDIPIIALTAFAFNDDRTRTLEAGCNDFLTKPISSLLLKETLEKYLK